MFSRTITDASTRIPKSIAPIEIRFAELPVRTISENANSSEHGIVNAAISEIGMSPRKTIRTRVTSPSPTITISRTVEVVT